MERIGQPNQPPTKTIKNAIATATAKINAHNFKKLLYCFFTQFSDKRTNKGCNANPTKRFVTKQGINRYV